MNTPIHSFKSGLRQAWQSFTVLTKHRSEPTWARLLISTGIGLGFTLLFTLVPGLILGRLLDGPWLRQTMGANLILCLCISYTIHAMFRTAELLISEGQIERLQVGGRGNWRAGVFSASIGIGGTILGGVVGMLLLGHLYRIDALGSFLSQPTNLRMSGFLTVLITAANIFWWKMRIKQQALQLAATEAQLRLLQGQIEPHFLFNTLANVQSLIDYDTGRAKQMLEAFTDYLRASLGQLRDGNSTLGAELDMAQSYLQLLQIRMNDRLSFQIEASAEARAALLPPLLLQPLIENAIHHGLEPKVEGGRVLIRAQVHQGRLEVQVDDDGLGLDAPRRPGRKAGAGLALGNIRARLQSLYPHNASLQLTQQSVGTLASLNLPYTRGTSAAH
ncbi:sensor histidine kinase [Paucibacter sp. Y2R2-4]|uniref:sensor histidine kinase n=1 Tax=Paucibacter sp. Y2R2-4 TaxID=2893553 RepID=UPI0021E3640A|nr:histidine kinase [Paucibacter sp. Y2R2-4]MCV2348225.1 histidine kinase [Paucibacter sp. Y2R2-4]